MPKMNVDELFEKIEVTLNGKTYEVKHVDQSTFDRVKEAADRLKDSGKSSDIVFAQLAVILGVEEKEFEGCDLRKASAALRFLTESITSQMEGKSGNA